MTTDGWMVAPEQVSAVLRAVDAAGEPLSDTVTTGQTLAGRRTDLMASGRAVIAEAWDDFMDTRALVPGKVIDVVTSAAAAVVDGVLVIIAGDESMADEWRGGHPEALLRSGDERMTAFVAHTLHDVPSSTAMAQLGADAQAWGQTVWDTMGAVNSEWKGLEGALTISPLGTPAGALDAPLISTSIFAEVMVQARNVLVNAAEDVFAALEKTRADLQGRILNLNERHRSHTVLRDIEVQKFLSDPENDPFITNRNHPDTAAYASANVNLGLLDQEAEVLALDVEMFHRDLAQAEQDLAIQIRAVIGGDSISRCDGTTVTTSQLGWGLVPPAPSQGPGVAPSAVSLGDYFDSAIGQSAKKRIHWLSTADEEEVAEWLVDHPEFFASIGYMPPADAAALYADLASRSTMDSSGAWVTGPLAALWNRAPGVIGNLNGLSAGQRTPWAEREVRRLLDDPDVTEDQKTKLTHLESKVKNGVHVLSVFIDETGDVRASLVMGEPASADQVITITHGISTDVGSLDEWETILRNVHNHANTQVDERDIASQTAVVLLMEWDSGDPFSVWQDQLPAEGATRAAALVEGFRYANPDAYQEGWAHSLGTTALAIAAHQSPGVFDHMTLFGSAGLTPEANAAMVDAIEDGDLTVSSTGAFWDWIAVWGRPGLVSTHPLNPSDSDGVDVFSSNGGLVEDYIAEDDEPVVGRETGGHNAGESDSFWYRIHRSPGWFDVHNVGTAGALEPFLQMPDDSVGYLDPRGESFLQAITDFAERVEARQ